ncbi:MAG: acyl-CoA dehydrogenase [Pseudomonadota bacterium]
MAQNFFARDDRDTKFVLFEHLEIDKLLSYEAFQDFSRDDFSMILDESLKFAREVIGPTMQEGDKVGAKFQDGRVTLPESFHKVMKLMADNGWYSVGSSREYGGQGLPVAVAGMVSEFFVAANYALMAYPGLSVGAGRLIETFGTAEDKALFVEKMYTGVWGGTMCLTEPDAGSDNGWLRTKAIPDPASGDPRVYKIEGNKYFITSGEHDLNENIIHLLIARIEGAPQGTKGVSLFIVPKIRVEPDGSLGRPNDVSCGGIEDKLGIKASATASLNFGENGGCRGILLGEPNSGMAKMFQMMNEARIGTGMGAFSLAAAAYDAARNYAKIRVQGPPFTNRRADRVRIIQHEDVRRLLMNLKSGTEAMRAFGGKLSFLIDVAEHDPDEANRKQAARRVDLLTPLIKSYCSDFSFELCRDAMQVLGGVGYCKEFPVEQYLRDCKITSIFEGINYIQSLDLVGRKLGMEGGKVFQDWLVEVKTFAGTHKEDPDFEIDFGVLSRAADVVAGFAGKYVETFSGGDVRIIPLTSQRFLDCFAETVLAQLMLEQGLIARDKLKTADPASADGVFYRGKVETVRFFCRNILPNVFGREASFKLADLSAVNIPEEAF